MNERLQHNMTPNKMLLDVNVSLKTSIVPLL